MALDHGGPIGCGQTGINRLHGTIIKGTRNLIDQHLHQLVDPYAVIRFEGSDLHHALFRF